MRKLMMLMLGIALVLVSAPPVAQAQLADAINMTNEAVQVLDDWPAVGKRYSVDLDKTAGHDFRNQKKATTLLQDALSKAKSGNASKMSIFKLEEAVVRAPIGLHKDSRLMAMGALFHLCKDAGGQPAEVCNKVPKYGSYTSP